MLHPYFLWQSELFVVNGVKNVFIGFVQSPDIYKSVRTNFSELRWIQGNISGLPASFFKGMRDDISPFPMLLNARLFCTCETGMQQKINSLQLKYFMIFFSKVKRCLLVLITWKNIEMPVECHQHPSTAPCQRSDWTVLLAFSIVLQTAFFLNLKVIIRTVIVEYLLISGWIILNFCIVHFG